MKIDIDKLLIRASASHHLMGEAKGKSDKDLYSEAVIKVAEYKAKFETLKVIQKPTKAQTNQAAKCIEKVQEYNQVILDLENSKDSNPLSVTAQSYLRKLYKEITSDCTKEINTKEVRRGKRQEEDSITLLSLEEGRFLKKNTIRLNDTYKTGLPDLFIGESIQNCEEGKDVKTSYSYFTFPDKLHVLPSVYNWQDLVYCDLTGAPKWTTAYCLPNHLGSVISKAKMNLFYEFGCPEESEDARENEYYLEYKKEACQIEKNMIFEIELFIKQNPNFDFDNDIKEWRKAGDMLTRSQRLREYTVYKDNYAIEALNQRIIDGRIWIKNNLM